ncbi:hypothetical protein JET18_19710 [Chryseobacterium sp. L7]|uniref:Septum formation initiator n=1 Tax=Chryseobacterium endalhagicum TaxID=2797638 RepID=A0ABS1QKF7_9FLAO|nr:hypothetical protein [Chryseobacterium endalhagicum]MBL1223080.1 hypothetical protein [Chryseobacterium endalhagicum]
MNIPDPKTDFKLNENEFNLNESQEDRIVEAREEYKNSAYLTEDKANQDMEEILKNGDLIYLSLQ